MYREMLKCKIHRATVTQADLHYVGSITIDSRLMEAAGLLQGEKVDVVDINNGARLSTYVIEGPRDSGVIGINGAAARLISPGDLVLIIGYALMSDSDARQFRPDIVFVTPDNKMLGQGHDPGEALPYGDTIRGDRV